MIKKIILATGLIVMAAGMTPVAFADSLNGYGACRAPMDRTSGDWNDPTCVANTNQSR